MFVICILHFLVLSIFILKKHIFALNLSSSRHKHCWFTPLTNESKKSWVPEVIDTFAIQSSLAYDVTDTDCWAQNGSTHGRHFKTFKCCETE